MTKMSSAEQTQYWERVKWIDAVGRTAHKPRMEHCEDEKGTTIYIRAVQGDRHGARTNPTLELEGTHFSEG